jgi:hypothetical protein
MYKEQHGLTRKEITVKDEMLLQMKRELQELRTKEQEYEGIAQKIGELEQLED